MALQMVNLNPRAFVSLPSSMGGPRKRPWHGPDTPLGSPSTEVPGRLKLFCCLVHCGEGCRGEGGVALGGSGGAGEEGVEDVVDEGLLLESGW